LFRFGLYPLIARSAILARYNGFAMPSLGFALVLTGFGGASVFTGKLDWGIIFPDAGVLLPSLRWALLYAIRRFSKSLGLSRNLAQII